MDANPNFAVFQGDIKNGYNKISRASILNAMKQEEDLLDTLVFTHLTLNTKSYVAMGSGTNMTDANFRVEEGVHQGAVPSGWSYSLGQNHAMQSHRARVEAIGGGVTVILDDNTTIAPREVLFNMTRQLAEDLSLVAVELQPHKSTCYINDNLRDETWDILRSKVKNGMIVDEDGNTHYGITTCNIPIGSRNFVKTYLESKKTRSLKDSTT
jgi:hypothetical protein